MLLELLATRSKAATKRHKRLSPEASIPSVKHRRDFAGPENLRSMIYVHSLGRALQFYPGANRACSSTARPLTFRELHDAR